MSRRLALTALPLLAVGLTVVPAHAAKPKPKPITGSYTVTLAPNPTLEATGELGDGCDTSPLPTGTDDHDFRVPAAGTLSIVLDSKEPTGNTDWDLYLLDAQRNIISSSHGATAHEETVAKFKKGEPVIIQVCNLAGAPEGTVAYTFTYR